MPTPLYILNEACKLLGEDELNTGSFTTNSYANSLLAGLNMTMRDIYKRNARWGILDGLSTFATVASTNNYDLSSALIITSGSTIPDPSKIKDITHPNNYTLKKYTKEEYDLHLLPLSLNETNTSLTSGDPAYYWYDRGLLYLYPTPDSAVTLTVNYQLDWGTDITSSTISSSTIIPFKTADLNMLIWGCIVNMSIRVPDERIAIFKQLYAEALLYTEMDNDRTPETMEMDPFFARGMM